MYPFRGEHCILVSVNGVPCSNKVPYGVSEVTYAYSTTVRSDEAGAQITFSKLINEPNQLMNEKISILIESVREVSSRGKTRRRRCRNRMLYFVLEFVFIFIMLLKCNYSYYFTIMLTV